MAGGMSAFMEGGGIVFPDIGKLFPQWKVDFIQTGRIIRPVLLGVEDAAPGTETVIRKHPFRFLNGIGKGQLGFGVFGLHIFTLVDMEHMVVPQQRNDFRDFLAFLIRLLHRQRLPEHYKAGLFSLADAAARVQGLLEGEILPGLEQQELIQHRIRPAGGTAVSAGAHACPGLLPGDQALFQLLQDAVRNDLIHVDAHARSLLL